MKDGEMEPLATLGGAARLDFKVGRTYLSRDGRQQFTVIAIEPDGETGLSIKAVRKESGGTVWFPPSGRFVPSSNPIDAWDLVAEIPSQDAAAVPEAPEGSPSLPSAPVGEALDLDDMADLFSEPITITKLHHIYMGAGDALIAEVRSLRAALSKLEGR